MLPAAHRMRRRTDFGEAIRRGRRGARRTLMVHLLRPTAADGATVGGAAGTSGPLPPVRVGLVVSRAVGNSVVRHRVSRRLRAVITSRLTSLPGGSRMVVRALPAAADASSAELASDLDAAVRVAMNGTGRRRAGVS